MQKTGIVMQIANGHAIVMTQDCEFRKIPLLDEMAIGQEVAFELTTELPQTVHKKAFSWINTPWKKTGIMAASLLLALGVWSSQSLLNPPKADAAVAYFTVDINPSVELSVDAQQKVVTVTALNSDAQTMIANLKLTGLPIKEAVQSLTGLAKSEGYLKVNTEVLITATPAVDAATLTADHLDLDALEGSLVSQVQSVVQQNGSSGGSGGVEVEGIRVSNDLRTAAKQAGISPGKYALYLALQSKGINVSINELKNNSISQVVAARGADAQIVLRDLKEDQLDQLLKQFQAAAKVPGQTDAVLPVPNKDGAGGQPTFVPPGLAKQPTDSQGDNGNSSAKGNGKPSGRQAVDHPGNGNHQTPAVDHKGNQGDNGDHGNQGDKGDKGNKDDRGDHNLQINLNDHKDDGIDFNFSWMFGHDNHNDQGNGPKDKSHH